MVIGKYVIRRAKTIKKRLINRTNNDRELVLLMIQIYNCRFCGICFYRTEQEFEKSKKFFNCI